MSKALKYHIARHTSSRKVYHVEEDCMGLKNANDTKTKTWDIIKRMGLRECPYCFED